MIKFKLLIYPIGSKAGAAVPPDLVSEKDANKEITDM